MTMFLQPDDYIIAMESTALSRRFTLDDLRRLRDVGISLLSKQLDWREIELGPGVYDWENVDLQFAIARDAGFRCIVLTPCQAPPFFPPEWYAKSKDGIVNGPAATDEMILRGQTHSPSHLSMWHAGAQVYETEFLRSFIVKYRADNVMFAHAVGSGEWFLPGGSRAFIEKKAMDDFQEKYGRPLRLYPAQDGMNGRQHDWETDEIVTWLHDKCLDTFCAKHAVMLEVNPSPEVYAPWHGMLQDWASAWDSGVLLNSLYAGVRQAFGNPPIISLQYTHHIHGRRWTDPFMQRMDARGVHVFGGAEYCGGLEKNALISAEDGSRLILGVKGDLSPDATIEPWMLDAIREAIGVLSRSEVCRWDDLWQTEEGGDVPRS